MFVTDQECLKVLVIVKEISSIVMESVEVLVLKTSVMYATVKVFYKVNAIAKVEDLIVKVFVVENLNLISAEYVMVKVFLKENVTVTVMNLIVLESVEVL